jgi:hypothetical protein
MARKKLTDGQKTILRRRRKIASMILKGETNKAVAKALSVSASTVARDVRWIRDNEPERLERGAGKQDKTTPSDVKEGHSNAPSTDDDRLSTPTVQDASISESERSSDGSPSTVTADESVSPVDTPEPDLGKTVPSAGDAVHPVDRSEAPVDQVNAVEEPVDHDDVKKWWEDGSSTLEDAALRRGTFSHATKGAIRSVRKEAEDLERFDSVPDAEKYTYFKNSVHQARFETITAVALAAMVAFIILWIAL